MTDKEPEAEPVVITDDAFDGPGWGKAAHDISRPLTGAADQPRRRRIRVSRRKRRIRRRIGLAMVILGGLVVVAALYIAVTGLLARSQLTTARAEVHTLRAEIAAGNLTGARTTATDLAKHAHRAHRLTTGPVWAVAASIPAGGEPLRTIRGITSSIDAIGGDALPQLVSASTHLDPATLRGSDGRIDLAGLSAVGPALDRAYATMAGATRTISALPPKTWLGTIDSARTDVLSQLTALGHTIRSADLAARIVPTMLGQSGPKHYFVAFQNDAEARGTGGLPGAFAIASAVRGKLTFTRFESDSVLLQTQSDVALGKDFQQLYGDSPTEKYGNANLSPNFPYAAQIWSSMWQKESGQRVDGVIAVDPSALSYLLGVTGPATLPDGSKVTAGNIVTLSQSTAYARFGKNEAERKQYLLDIATAVSKKILDTRGDTAGLVRAAGRAAGERRLLVWSATPAVQADLAQTSVGGVIPITNEPYVGLSIVNDGGNKLDYYLDRSMKWQRTGCGSTRHTTVTITLTNNAPASGLSPDVIGRSDRRSYPTKPGDNRLEVGYFATEGALMSSVTVDGKPGTASIGAEQGHPVYTVDLELPRGTSRTIVLHLTEPAGSGAPLVLRQPLVRPLSVTVHDAHCG